MLHEGRVHTLERRHGMVPDAVAGVSVRCVRTVVHMRDAMRRQIRLRFRARRVQHRAQELAALRRDTGQAAQTAAAREVEQQRLGVVIRRVRRCDPVIAVCSRAVGQKTHSAIAAQRPPCPCRARTRRRRARRKMVRPNVHTACARTPRPGCSPHRAGRG